MNLPGYIQREGGERGKWFVQRLKEKRESNCEKLFHTFFKLQIVSFMWNLHQILFCFCSDLLHNWFKIGSELCYSCLFVWCFFLNLYMGHLHIICFFKCNLVWQNHFLWNVQSVRTNLHKQQSSFAMENYQASRRPFSIWWCNPIRGVGVLHTRCNLLQRLQQ